MVRGGAARALLGAVLRLWWRRLVPGAARPTGSLDAATAVALLPSIPDQVGGVVSRLAQLEHVGAWAGAQGALAPSADWEALLREVVSASVRRYATHTHGNAVMLIHAATAPNAVLRVLPSLPRHQWPASVAAAWSASAAIHAAYSPATGAPRLAAPSGPLDAFDRAVHHGDEHVVKLADTALDAYAWTGDRTVLAAVERAASLIEPIS